MNLNYYALCLVFRYSSHFPSPTLGLSVSLQETIMMYSKLSLDVFGAKMINKVVVMMQVNRKVPNRMDKNVDPCSFLSL